MTKLQIEVQEVLVREHQEAYMMENNKNKRIWIIRFTNGALASCYGTKKNAVERAEEKKDLYGGDYTIIA